MLKRSRRHGQHKILLGFEMEVERSLGILGGGSQFVEVQVLKSVMGHQSRGTFKNQALAGRPFPPPE
jgi:hypothetical protein